MNVTVSISGQTIAVQSPYNENFVSRAKEFGGKWNDSRWVFDARDEERVRALCRECYGTDGLQSDLVTIRARFDESDSVRHGPITINGRPIARAYGRDSGAKLGDGVVLLEGGFGSGGSVKNWTTCVTKSGAEVLVRDFPRAVAEKLIAGGADWISIEPEKIADDEREALDAERVRLTARLAEIDKLLGGLIS